MTEQSAMVEKHRTQQVGAEPTGNAAVAPVMSSDEARNSSASPSSSRDQSSDIARDGLITEYLKIKREFADYRQSTIRALPGFVVNNSSNLMAVMQLTGDVLMFKGSNNLLLDKTQLANSRNGVQWYHYLTEPPKNIFKGLLNGGLYQGKISDFLKPSFYAKSLSNLVDLNSAAKLDWEAAVNAAHNNGTAPRLVNRWQTRSTALNLVGWGINMLLPEEKEKPEEVDKMVALGKTNLPAYVGARLWQAVDIPHWRENKAQMTGSFVTLGGMCTLFSGFRNVDRNPVSGLYSYRMNPAHSIAGIFTTLAGLSLLFSFTKEESYRNFGAAMAGRMMFLPSSIGNRFKVKADGSMDPGRFWYTGGQATYQSQSMVGMLFGGAEKNPDGTIVDYQEIREAAKAKVVAEQRTRDQSGDEMPAVTLQEVTEHTPPAKEQRVAAGGARGAH